MVKSITKVQFKSAQPIEIELIDLETLYQKRFDQIVLPHRANFYHIFLFHDCAPVHTIDFNPVQISTGMLLFVNKERVHFFDKGNCYKGKVLIFTDEFFCKNESDRQFLHNSMLFNETLQVKTNETVDFSGLFEAIEIELRQKDQFQTDILRNLLHNLLLVCERFAATQQPLKDDKSVDAKLVTRFKELLDNDFAQIKKVSDYADMLKITEKRLALATAKVTSKSPKQMIDERILLEAKRLLSYTTQSVKEIAFALGFDEPTNFNKYFRKHVGNSPVQFRLSFRK